MMINTINKAGTSAIGFTLSQPREWQLEEVRVHLNDVGGTGNLTVAVDSAVGSAYDTVLLAQDMTTVKDLVWLPEHPIQLDKGDAVVVSWANPNGRTCGVEIKYRAAV